MDWAAAGVCALAAGGVSPLLAATTLAVPADGGKFALPRRWWTGGGASPIRWAGVAVAAVVVAGAVGGQLGWSWGLPAFWLMSVLSVALFIIDVEHRRLPYVLVVPTYLTGLTFFAIAAAATGDSGLLIRPVIAAVSVGGGFFVVALVFAGQFGLGDVVLLGALSLHLGFLGWTEVFVGLLAGLTCGVIVGMTRITRKKSKAFPLGPALLAGWLLATISHFPNG